jgi:hypothetical protein
MRHGILLNMGWHRTSLVLQLTRTSRTSTGFPAATSCLFYDSMYSMTCRRCGRSVHRSHIFGCSMLWAVGKWIFCSDRAADVKYSLLASPRPCMQPSSSKRDKRILISLPNHVKLVCCSSLDDFDIITSSCSRAADRSIAVGDSFPKQPSWGCRSLFESWTRGELSLLPSGSTNKFPASVARISRVNSLFQ